MLIYTLHLQSTTSGGGGINNKKMYVYSYVLYYAVINKIIMIPIIIMIDYMNE